MKIPYCNICKMWSFKEHTHLWRLLYAYNSLTRFDIEVIADGYEEAYARGMTLYDKEVPHDIKKQIFIERGLPHGFPPYFRVISTKRTELEYVAKIP